MSGNFVLSGNKNVHTYSLGSCLICFTSPKNLLGFSEKKPVRVYISSHPIKIIPLIFWIWLESSLQELPTRIGKYTSGALELENPMCFGTHRCSDWWNFNFPRLIPFCRCTYVFPRNVKWVAVCYTAKSHPLDTAITVGRAEWLHVKSTC